MLINYTDLMDRLALFMGHSAKEVRNLSAFIFQNLVVSMNPRNEI